MRVSDELRNGRAKNATPLYHYCDEDVLLADGRLGCHDNE